MAFQFTPGQRQAIETRGSSLLISAAAGSGKTRVLTERLMAYVTREQDPHDIDSFLVITYTRAAAAELRSRILSELSKRSAASPLDKRLRRQQNLCCRAPIGTIHSFCTEILRENSHRLGLPPAFRVMDEDQSEKLKLNVLDKVLEQRYERIDSDPAFSQLVDTVCAGRDDSALAGIVLALHGKLRSHAYPEDWAAEQMDALDARGVEDAGETLWGQEILEDLKSSALYWAQAMDSAVADIYQADEKIIKAYGETFAVTRDALWDFVRALDLGWDKARTFLPLPFPRLGVLRGYPDTALAERVKAIRQGCKDSQEDWSKSLGGESATLLSALRLTARPMRALLELVLDLDRAFSAEKRRRGEVDFSDLEHDCARLLVDKASGEPSALAKEISRRYTEIMVDEYQDVNAVQEMIFRAVSKAGRNLFMVGDMKQSIYRFRLADPNIFLEKYKQYADVDSPGDVPGRRILLQENFRSRKSVLDAANHVFSNIMSESLGEMAYDDAASLRWGARHYDLTQDCPVELNILDPIALTEEGESPRKAEWEALFVARRILQMVAAGTPVSTDSGTRPCSFGDFAILMRSPGANGSIYHRVLAAHNIPVSSQQGGGFFNTLEVTVALDFLTIIDNPHADVSLISVLRSPLFCFSPDELSAIRAQKKSADFYTALDHAARSGSEKCAAFLSRLRWLRAAAMDLSLSELLWKIFDESGLFTICLAMSDGEQRRNHLMQLMEYARSFEQSGSRGLFAFVSYLRRQAQRGAEPALSAESNSVAIMSIHKSKGLEFPFVFLCDLSHHFNVTDTTAPILLHAQLGLGPQVTDPDRGIRSSTLARQAIAARLKKEMLSEEMRVLYVAMTRARERLIMSGTWKNAADGMEKLRPTLSSPLAPELLRSAASPLRWLVSAAMLPQAQGLIDCKIVEDVEQDMSPPLTAAPSQEQQTLRDTLDHCLSFRYPHAAAVDLPSKLTATGLKKLAEPDEESTPLHPEPKPRSFRLPQPGQALLNAAERGIATHLLMQFMDFDKAAREEDIREELSRLCASGHLTPEQAQAVDVEAVLRFGRSSLCQRMRQADELHREFRFTLLVDASEHFSVDPGEQQLMQGVVDCFLIENGAITIIDYKTDNISPDQLQSRTAGYTPQVLTYAKALRRITGLPVNECILYFLRLGEASRIQIS